MMMSGKYVIFVALCVHLCDAYAYSSRATKEQIKNYPNHCLDDYTDKQYELGRTVYNNPECERVTCGFDHTLEVIGCGVIAPADGCKIVMDLQLKHPKCCPQEVCENFVTPMN